MTNKTGWEEDPVVLGTYVQVKDYQKLVFVTQQLYLELKTMLTIAEAPKKGICWKTGVIPSLKQKIALAELVLRPVEKAIK